MKKSRKTKVRKISQTVYMKMLQSLRSSLTSEYSKVLPKETRGLFSDMTEIFPDEIILHFPFSIYRFIKLQRTLAQIAEPITPEALQAMACIKR